MDTRHNNTTTKAKDVFGDIIEGSKNEFIDPTSCVPLTRIRNLSECGVKRLASMFDGEAPTIGMSKGHSSSGAMPVVVELKAEDKDIVLRYFIDDKNMNETVAVHRYNGKDTWYGIVDGCHRHAALLSLMNSNPDKWGLYMWWITVVQKTSVDRLQAFARDRNEKQRKQCVVDFTLYDMLRNMKNVARNFQILRGEYIDTNKPRKGLITEIADEYCGGFNAANSTSRQLAGVAIRLSNEVIECIGRIMNTDHPVLARKILESKGNRSKRCRIDTDLIDTRVFRNLFNTSTLRSPTTFKDASVDSDRVNALMRCQYLAINEGLKSVSGTRLNDEVKNAIAARREAEKMSIVVGSEEWPPELEIVRLNLLQTTKLDEQVRNNTGEDLTILPRLREIFEAHHGRRASLRITLFQRGQIVSKNGELLATEESSDESCSSAGNNGEKRIPIMDSAVANESRIDENNRKNGTEPLHQRDSGGDFPSQDVQSGATDNTEMMSNMDRLGISVYQMSWEAYQDTIVQSKEHIQVDMILTDPPYCLPTSRVPTGEGYNDHVDEREMDLFSQFARKVLVPGGYCVIFTSFHLFMKWKRIFGDQNFVVSNAPIVFAKRTGMLQKSSSPRYPQNGCEFALLARKRGDHPQGFQPNFSEQYRLIKCSHSRRFSIIDSIPPVWRYSNNSACMYCYRT